MRLLAILAGLAAAAAKPTARTKRKPGLLIVGLGGNNGATVLAGLHANNMKLTWEGAKKQCTADYTGCITQTRAMRRKGLAPFKRAAVGGWDIRPTPIGQALKEARILDYDLAGSLRRIASRSCGVSCACRRRVATGGGDTYQRFTDAQSKVNALRRTFDSSRPRIV